MVVGVHGEGTRRRTVEQLFNGPLEASAASLTFVSFFGLAYVLSLPPSLPLSLHYTLRSPVTCLCMCVRVCVVLPLALSFSVRVCVTYCSRGFGSSHWAFGCHSSY